MLKDNTFSRVVVFDVPAEHQVLAHHASPENNTMSQPDDHIPRYNLAYVRNIICSVEIYQYLSHCNHFEQTTLWVLTLQLILAPL